MSKKIHFMTINYRGNVEVYHKNEGGNIYVLFRKRVDGKWLQMVMTIEGVLLSNTGFSNVDVGYYSNFVRKCAPGIIAESEGML